MTELCELRLTKPAGAWAWLILAFYGAQLRLNLTVMMISFIYDDILHLW